MKVVFCNCPVEKAREIACNLVENKYAACVNIIPQIQSVYRWQGKICNEQESTLLIKIDKNDFSLVEEKIREIHPYDVPEIIAVEISEVHQPYLDWLKLSTKK